MSAPDALTHDEEAVLSVYQIRRIHPGYGLTATTFRKELKYLSLPRISDAIASLLDRGYLGTHPEIKDFFLLTLKGDGYLVRSRG